MRIYPQLLVDQEFKSLGDQGFMGTLNDRQFAFLRSKGYVNALADMMTSWLSYSPANLFSLNEPGIWLDPSDVANLDWRRNLLTYSEQFDSAAWSKDRGGVSANTTTAPDGTLTADTLTATSGLCDIYQSVLTLTSGQVYTGTVYLKRKTGTGPISYVTLSGGRALITETVTSSEWTRVTTTSTASSGTGFCGIRLGTSGDELYIWGAQLELGSVATDYQRISDVNTEVLERFPRTTMFQDRAGSTAVTTPGQSVGLRLDKSKGLVLGSELVTNGDFSGGTTGWTAINGTLAVSGGQGAVTRDISVAYVSRPFTTVVGRIYRLSGDIISFTGVNALIRKSDNQTDTLNTITAGTSAVGRQTLVFTATATTTYVVLQVNTGTAYFDNISVKELPGFHAVANSDAARGIYGIEPLGGRRNLLTFTEQFDNVAWAKTAATVTANAGVAPDGTSTADFLIETSGTSEHYMAQQQAKAASSITYTLTAYFKAGSGSRNFGLGITDGVTGGYAAVFSTSGSVVAASQAVGTVTGWTFISSSVVLVSDGWYRASLTASTNTATRVDAVCYAVNGVNRIYAGNGTSSILIWGAQLETGSTATAYQRVTTQYDVTEAGKQTLHYVQYDGSDDGYVTPTITPGIDKVQVFAGVRKLSDAAAGVVAETSTSRVTNSGAFTLLAPAATAATYAFTSKGTTDGGATSGTSFAAPISNTMTGIGDISGDNSVLRVNGTQVAQSTSDQGTGNYLAYPLYIGRRGGVSSPFNGRDYGICVRFGANLDAATISATENYMAQKTGVTL